MAKKEKENEENVTPSQTDLRKARRRRKIKRRIIKLVTVILMVFAGIMLYITHNLWMPALEHLVYNAGTTVENDGELASGNFPVQLGNTGETKIAGLGNYLVVVTDTYITYFDEKGEKQKSFQHLLGAPIIESCNDRILVYDVSGYSYVIANKKEVVYTKKLEDKILMARQAKNGYTAVVTQTDNYPAFLTIYDKEGKAVYKWANGEQITDVAFSENGSGCIVSTMESNGGTITSEIHGLQFDQQKEAFVISDLHTLIYKTAYTESGNIWVVGDDCFLLVATDGTVVQEKQLNNTVEGYTLSAQTAAVVTASLTNGESLLYTADETEITQTTIDEAVQIHALDDLVYILTDDTVFSVNSTGKTVATAELSDNYSNFVYIDEMVYLLGYREIDKVEFLS